MKALCDSTEIKAHAQNNRVQALELIHRVRECTGFAVQPLRVILRIE